MWMSVKIALRNILRNKRRTFITLSVIATGSIAIILSGGWFDNMFEGLRESTIYGRFGHLQVNKRGFYEKGVISPFDYMIEDYEGLRSPIESLPYVNLVMPRLEFSGLISSGDATVSCIGLGVDPEKEAEMASKISVSGDSAVDLVSGQDLSSEEQRGVLLGKGLASAMDAKVGDYLVILTTTKDGSINGVEVRVRGIFESMAKEFDDRAIKLPISTVQRLLNTSGYVQSIVVVLDETKNTFSVKSNLENLFNQNGLDMEIKTWLDLAYFYKRVIILFGRIFGVITIIISSTVILGIANTMTMVIFERMREIGTIMAMGTTRIAVLRLFLLEGFVLGLVGGTIGVFLGALMAKIISMFGIPMPPPPGSTRGFIALINVVPIILVKSFLIAVISSVISALYPAIKASRLMIADALRYI